MRRMTRWLAHCLPIAGVLLAALPAQAALFGVPENLPPWGLTADLPAGQRGIYADLAQVIAARSPTPIEIRFVPYGRMLQQVKAGELDYAFGVISPATAEAAPFTAVIARLPMIVVARKGLALTKLDDLHGFNEVGYLRGGSCGAVVDGDAAIKRVAQDSYDSAIRKIAAGRLDAWCSVKAGFTYALGVLKMEADMGEHLEYGEVKIGFQVTGAKAESTDAQALTAVVETLVKEGAVGEIFTRYVGAPYAP